MKYQPQQIESKWQQKWRDTKLYDFKNDPKKKKFYSLVELPYTSGDLHVGHWFSWTVPDIYSRYLSMNGYDVFFPHGYDTTGLPAENAAIKRNIHPRDWTMSNIETMQKQFHTMGSMINLDDVHIACSDSYMKWNQWIFIQMYKKGIAYRGMKSSNWCPVDQTVLADEHVVGGKCWRCDSNVEQKDVAQWFLRITHYADDLIWPDEAEDKASKIDWPKSVKTGQNNWIGKKVGIEITYDIEDSKEVVSVFTTRPDTNFGATFIALAPEHPITSKITSATQKKEVEQYIKSVAEKTEVERTAQGREKTGVFTGAYAINHLTGRKMPIWISDFVLVGFGTGALVGVPGHDKRDFEFANKFNLEVIRVVAGQDGDASEIKTVEQVQEDEGKMVNSDFLDGMDIHDATEKIMDYIENKKWGVRTTTYHIRDWSVSRQRYWGTPVPIIYCSSRKCIEEHKTCKVDGVESAIVPVPEDDLPVTLPYDVDFTPRGKAPLASNKQWMSVKCPVCDGDATRDPETLDTFFDSAWYFFRYLNNQYNKGPFDPEKAAQIMPVDVYFGGAEHTLGHTLYARFFTKFFKDLGLISFDEFAKKRVQHGLVLGPDGNKMSKSKGNVINPDSVVKEYGADTVRMYLSFMMPYEGTGPWSDESVAGMYRLLHRIWKLAEKVGEEDEPTSSDAFVMNHTIANVSRDMAVIKCNTALAFIMTWVNHLQKKKMVSKFEYETLLKLLAPFAPHICEQLWEQLGNEYSIHKQTWPIVNKSALQNTNVNIPIQVNGKVRGMVNVASDTSEDAVLAIAMDEVSVKRHIENKKYKTIFVPGKILNIVLVK